MMDKAHSEEMIEAMDNILSRINGLEVATTDEYQKKVVSVLKVLAQSQKGMIEEFDHLKKAIDLLTMELFKVSNKS